MSIFTWDSSLEIFGALLVAIGCIGELWLICIKPPKGIGKLKNFERKKHFREKIFVGMVALGVSMELIALPSSLSEVQQLKKVNLELEAKIQPRRISPQAQARIMKRLKDVPKVTIDLYWMPSDRESFVLASQIEQLLKDSGFNVVERTWPELGPLFFGVEIMMPSNKMPSQELWASFVKPFLDEGLVNSVGPSDFVDEKHFGILVGAKPFK